MGSRPVSDRFEEGIQTGAARAKMIRIFLCLLFAALCLSLLPFRAEARIDVHFDGMVIPAKVIAVARVDEIRTIHGGSVAVTTVIRPIRGSSQGERLAFLLD